MRSLNWPISGHEGMTTNDENRVGGIHERRLLSLVNQDSLERLRATHQPATCPILCVSAHRFSGRLDRSLRRSDSHARLNSGGLPGARCRS